MKTTDGKIVDSRYPYTYACDLIRAKAGYNSTGAKLSRSDASQIRELISTILKIDDGELAKKLADYYLANRKPIDEQCVMAKANSEPINFIEIDKQGNTVIRITGTPESIEKRKNLILASEDL